MKIKPSTVAAEYLFKVDSNIVKETLSKLSNRNTSKYMKMMNDVRDAGKARI